jgi:MFS family permease
MRRAGNGASNSLGAPVLWLSLMSSAATLPLFLFTLPAGALADLADRRRLLRISNGWLACSAGLLACCAVLGGLTPSVILAGVFLLGTGFAFQAPVVSASIPGIVGKEQLPSAIALGGIQMNLAGIVAPALGGLLIPFVGVGAVFGMNAVAFLLVLVAVSTWKRKSPSFNAPLEGLFDSLASAVRYMCYAPGVQIVLLRNFVFDVLIGAIPALLPVVGLEALQLDAVNLGLVFTSLGLGSLAGAVFVLEPARKRLKPNQMTVLGGIALAMVYR